MSHQNRVSTNSTANTPGVDLLVVAPHPDDAELFAGGLIALSIEQKHSVAIVDLTKGELSSRGTLEIRAKETVKASQALGVTLRQNLELPDGSIGIDGSLSRSNQLSKLVDSFRTLKPKLLCIPYHKERHPDHQRASILSEEAAFFSGVKHFQSDPTLAPFSIPRIIFYPMRVEASTSFIVDISSVIDKKWNAIKAFGSQFELKNEHPTLISSPLNLSSLKAREEYYGSMIGSSAGEPYVMKSPPPLYDPVNTFKQMQAPYFFNR